MRHALNAKTLEQSAITALTLFTHKKGGRQDWLFDQHFVVEHLTPTLLYRLQAHLPIKSAELVELWAEHLGLPETTLQTWKPELEPFFADKKSSILFPLKWRHATGPTSAPPPVGTPTATPSG